MKVLLIDNYDSFVYNIAQYLGELGAKPLVYRNDKISVKEADNLQPDRIVLSPGPGTPEAERYFGNCLSIIKVLGPKIPTLGICLGHQGIAYAFGGNVSHACRLMHGKTSRIRHDEEGIFQGISNPFEATRYHSLVANLFKIPSCFKITAYSLDDCEIMGIRHAEYPIDGIQFHPESILTAEGKKILKNFLDGDK
ncbi:MAG: aminodeoxychorismate/anthranilate synthase component II [Candidatus Bathyarchaeota archaeon]|nr:aminodeoxychorismate/anthranilate synthase component II [Candidatus Bathyarchaeota archaeon]